MSRPIEPDAVARLLRRRVATGTVELPASGRSMAGIIESGSLVGVVAAEHARPGEIWAFVGDDGKLVVHTVREVAEDTVIARGVANSYDDAPVAPTRLVGRVVHARAIDGTVIEFGTIDRLKARADFALRRRFRWIRRAARRRHARRR